MRCRLLVNLDTDIPFWVSLESFLNNFDQNDFHMRKVQNVADAYLESWFCNDTNGNRCFIIPPVSVHDGITQFISERHRTAVLMRHLKELPLSFDSRFISETDKQWIDSVAFRPIDLDADVVELPELPIKQTLP